MTPPAPATPEPAPAPEPVPTPAPAPAPAAHLRRRHPRPSTTRDEARARKSPRRLPFAEGAEAGRATRVGRQRRHARRARAAIPTTRAGGDGRAADPRVVGTPSRDRARARSGSGAWRAELRAAVAAPRRSRGARLRRAREDIRSWSRRAHVEQHAGRGAARGRGVPRAGRLALDARPGGGRARRVPREGLVHDGLGGDSAPGHARRVAALLDAFALSAAGREARPGSTREPRRSSLPGRQSWSGASALGLERQCLLACRPDRPRC